jgi:hypothetical protein
VGLQFLGVAVRDGTRFRVVGRAVRRARFRCWACCISRSCFVAAAGCVARRSLVRTARLAELIISGWRDSGVVIKSQCEIEPVAFSFRGRIVEFSDSRRVRFLNVDGRAEFAFDIGDDFDCWYLEPRDFPEDAKTTVCVLTFFFSRHTGLPKDADFIVLSELA